ncbi:MAG: class I SAM-dependent methyltransferase [Clostridia bacterium]|nr:class I SAM-dependent methyltransferase [Clostridia bacterium]
MYNKIANFYDELGWADNASLEAEIINNILVENNVVPENYIDLGCGTGELIKVLSEVFDEVNYIGVDVSEDMIGVAKKKLKDNKKAKFIVKDMRSVKLEKRAECISCMYDTINHLLIKEHWQETFNNVYELLKYGGVFVMDYVPPKALKEWNGTYVMDDDTSCLVRKIVYDDKTNVLTTNINAFVKANYFGTYRNIKEQAKETSFEIKDVLKMLKIAGFKKVTMYDETFKKISAGKASKAKRVYFGITK